MRKKSKIRHCWTGGAKFLYEVRLKLLLDFRQLQALSLVQTIEKGIDDLLCLVPAVAEQKTIKHVLAAHGVANFRLALVLAQFGEVNNFVRTGVGALAVDFEHDPLRVLGRDG